MVGALIALAALAQPAESDPAPADTILVIVSEKSPLTNLSSTQLRRLFQKRGFVGPKGGNSIAINLPPRHPTRVTFDRLVLNLEPDQVGRYWIDRKIRGQTGPPKTVRSGRLLQRFVKAIPKTVGYITGRTLPPGVRALRIDGFSPDHPRYPLRSSP